VQRDVFEFRLMDRSSQNETGLRLIVGYKLVKAGIGLLLGFIVLFGAASLSKELRQVALHIMDHATAAWSVALAHRLIRVATEQHLHVVGMALLLDGVLSSVEGWALHRRYRWASWPLVIAATSCLLPFEAAALVRRLTLGRIVLLSVNLAVVTYLLRHRAAFQRKVGSAKDATSRKRGPRMATPSQTLRMPL
jgi:uncharacterized membrane protein (DUF2068 family)